MGGDANNEEKDEVVTTPAMMVQEKVKEKVRLNKRRNNLTDHIEVEEKKETKYNKEGTTEGLECCESTFADGQIFHHDQYQRRRRRGRRRQ